MSDEKVKQLRLSNITIDAGIQPRAKGLNEAKVEEYRAAIQDGDEFPPLIVYQSDLNTLWLSEGFHRAEAYKRAGVKQVPCIVRKGERKDARLNACGSNYAHGLPRTNDDKRRALEMVLEDFPTWSNPQIAKAARVSVEFVRKHRPAEAGEKRDTSDGRQYPARSGASATVADAPSETLEKPTVTPPEDESGINGSSEATEVPSKFVDEPDREPKDLITALSLDHLANEAAMNSDYRSAAEYESEANELRELIDANGGNPVVRVPASAAPEPEPEPADPGAEFVDAVEAICRDADQLAARMKALKASPFAYSIHIDSSVSQVEAARKALWQGRPAHVCPYCRGEDKGEKTCKACQGTGRVKKTTFDSGTKAVGEAA